MKGFLTPVNDREWSFLKKIPRKNWSHRKPKVQLNNRDELIRTDQAKNSNQTTLTNFNIKNRYALKLW
ncbi:unnamed protein product [Heterobilharzia americana]|nr:unnamed protein product [Heterobilharzia americana]